MLDALGIRHLEELSDAQVARRLADPETLALQISDPARPMALVPGARVLRRDGPVPEALRAEPRTVLVVAPDRELALREASRLSRAGVRRVVVFTGESATLARWTTAARNRRDVSPLGTRDHPSR